MSTPDPIQCPGCGDGSSITSLGKRHAVYPAGCVMLVGLPFAILHQTSAPTLYRCGNCGKDFGIRSVLARVCLIILITLALCLVGGLVAVIFR
jgi:DNA-directed RNA polymerase subunit RPC12/RpoP